MRILYGVVGEGMGHATRSRVVLEHLRLRGHEVRIVASDFAATFLNRHFGSVLPIEGFRFVFNEHNRVSRWQTLGSILYRGLLGLPRNVATYFEMLSQGFEPDVVISDFESWAHLYGKVHNIPVLSIDNIQIVSRCQVPPSVREGRQFDYYFNRTMVKAKLPFCDHYFLTSFFAPEVVAERTSIHPPVLRREILEATPERGDHVLVYQSGGVGELLMAALRKAGVECRAYGIRRGIEGDEIEGNIRHRAFDETTFVEDLRTARAVVATSGATLLSESLQLQKPVLATPIAGQFEQSMNALFLEAGGYGRAALSLHEDTLSSFLGELGRYEEALAGYQRNDNHPLLSAVDRHLASLELGERRSEWAAPAGA